MIVFATVATAVLAIRRYVVRSRRQRPAEDALLSE